MVSDIFGTLHFAWEPPQQRAQVPSQVVNGSNDSELGCGCLPHGVGSLEPQAALPSEIV